MEPRVRLPTSLIVLLTAALVMAAGACSTKTENEILPAAPPQSRNITMGTAGMGGSNYPIGIVMSSLWTATIPGVSAVAITTDGSPHNIALLRTDDVDVAICRSLEAYRAFHGKEPYLEAMPWIRSLTGGLFSDVFQVVATKASGISSIASFRGKRIAVGPQGSGGEIDARETLAAYGLSYDDVKASFVDFSLGMEMIKEGMVDGGIIGVALGAAAMEDLMLSGTAVLLPINDEAMAALKKTNPFMMRRVIPADTYPNQDYPVATVGTPPDIIIVCADLDEELAYKMTKTLYTNLGSIRAVSGLLAGFGGDFVLEEDQMLVPYHDGARKYFREMGWLK